MRFLTLLPMEEFAQRLNEHAKTSSGADGAIAGVGMVLVQAAIRWQRDGAPPDPANLIASVAAGGAYGFLKRQ
jgi:hypothetical protein